VSRAFLAAAVVQQCCKLKGGLSSQFKRYYQISKLLYYVLWFNHNNEIKTNCVLY
jgi:hypothetical protein